MTRNKKTNQKASLEPVEPEETLEDLPFAPPETDYLAERYIVRIPIDDEHFEDRWKLRVYAEQVLEKQLGDAVQLTSMRVKKPHVIAKSKAKILKRTPTVRVYVTVKF